MTSALVVLGQPEHRRTQALRAAWARRGLPAPRVFAYAEVLASPQRFLDAAAQAGAVKLDSPGGSDAVHAALVQRALAQTPDHRPAPRAHGEWVDSHLRHHGFADLLQALARDLPGVHWLNPPDQVLCMRDKWRCQQALLAAGVEVPPLLGLIAGHDAFWARLDATGADRVFIKARYGSSAAGVVAYQRRRDGHAVACTTVEVERQGGRVRLFNRLRLQRYTDPAALAGLIDALAAQGAYAERWVPKPRAPTADPAHFDVRVVAGSGRPRQRVARIARGPITNLHLGNRRAAPEILLDAATLARVEQTVVQAAAVFGRSRCIGFDLVPGHEHCRVLEANAFGDDLQDVTWEGRDALDDQADWLAGLNAVAQCPTGLAHA